MNILYFHQHFSTLKGAAGTRSYEIATRLISKGHRVTMVCGSGFLADTGLTTPPHQGIRRGCVDGIDVIEICLPYSNYDRIPKRAITFVKYSLKSIAIALREKTDLIFATSTPLTAAIPGIVMRILNPKIKFIFEVRDLWPELPRAMGVVKNPLVIWGLSILEQLSYSAMHAGVALSPGILRGMRKKLRAPKMITMIPNGCDLQLFNTDPKAGPKSRFSSQILPDKGLRCIFTGAHGVANGLDAVLDVAKVLQSKERTDIQFIFIGDGKCKPSLVNRAEAEGLKNCRFLDPIPKYQLAKLLQHVDVGLMILKNVPAFYYGTSPNKFFDYISCGLPVVNNYPGWLAKLITENHCGIAVPPVDPHAFARALIKLADEPALRQKMSHHSRLLAESKFSRDRLTDQLVTFIEDVARARHSTVHYPIYPIAAKAGGGNGDQC